MTSGTRPSPYARPAAAIALGIAAMAGAPLLAGAALCAWLAAPHLAAGLLSLTLAVAATGALVWLRWGARAPRRAAAAAVGSHPGPAQASAPGVVVAGSMTAAPHPESSATAPTSLSPPAAEDPRQASRPRAARAALALLVASLGAALALAAPPGLDDDEARLVRSRFLPGVEPSSPWFGRIPEVEVVRLGAHVGLLPAERRDGWTARGFDSTYEAIDASGDLAPTSWVVDAWAVDRGHAWVARPAGPGPFPLLVVLHGSGGPFQFLPHAIAREAVARGWAVVFPSWGLNTPQAGRRWWSEAGRRRVLDSIGLLPEADPRRVVLVGLSAGGIGAIDVLAHHPGVLRGAALISGVAIAPFDAPSVARTPLLVVHGERDARMPMSLATSVVEDVRAAGGAVELERIAGDHFILLTHREPIVRRVLDWADARIR